MEMQIGYARVSTADQNLDLQRDALTKAGCQRIFEEKKSGRAGSKRPELDAALAFLRPRTARALLKDPTIPVAEIAKRLGVTRKTFYNYFPAAVLVVWKLDRLGRSLVEMMRTIDGLRRDDVRFRSLTEGFDSDTAHGRFALQMHGAMAEYFLDLNRERTMEGLKAALARGRKGGRPPKLSEADRAAYRRADLMPIRAQHRWLYPIDWPQLSAVIRFERAGGRCEHCGRPHGQLVCHLGDGRWWDQERNAWRDGRGRLVRGALPSPAGDTPTTRVFLATAHLDHDPGNSHPRNLAALCQRCHMLHDRPEHRRRRWITLRMRKAIGDLFLGTYRA